MASDNGIGMRVCWYILRESGLTTLVGVLGESRSVGPVCDGVVALVGSVLAFRVVSLDGARAEHR